jgi:hypothetical protein
MRIGHSWSFILNTTSCDSQYSRFESDEELGAGARLGLGGG